MPFRITVLVLMASVLGPTLVVHANGPSLYKTIERVQAASADTVWELVYIANLGEATDEPADEDKGIFRFKDAKSGMLFTIEGSLESVDSISFHTRHEIMTAVQANYRTSLDLLSAATGAKDTVNKWSELNSKLVSSQKTTVFKQMLRPELYDFNPPKTRNLILSGDIHRVDNEISYGVIAEYEEVRK